MTPIELLRQRRTDLTARIDAARDRANTILAMPSDELTPEILAEAPTLRQRIAALSKERDEVNAAILDAETEEARAANRRAAQVAHGSVPVADPADISRTDRRAGSPAAGPVWVRTADRRPAVVERTARFAEHPVVAAHAQARAGAEQAVIGQHGGVANFVRALTTTSGTALVPTVWAGQIIDRARNLAAVIRAGAEIVPMDAKQVQIGRLTGDPTAAFRTEGSTITASDPTFDNVTLDSKTMSALVVGSLEWFQDAPNADQVVTEAIAQAIALQLDLVSLYGSITTGAGSINLPTPPNPRGVLGALLAVASSSVLGAATNGTTQTALSYWNEILDLLFTVRDYNEEPTALIWNSKAARQYAKAYDSTGQPLALPADVAAIQRLTTNQIPSYTQGTMTSRATDVFAGDWRQLLIGQRLELTIQVLTERYAESGQIGIVAHWRGDVQVARPRAFAVYRAIQGA
ncbi:phage major capsid protein [Micromonospora maritima]|uniref:phage major capsid protein n=1 Tax=Micromonospora maritima TaxID=986711 RepID=UPI0037A227B6